MIACTDYYRETQTHPPPPDNTSTWTYTNGPRADTTTYTTTSWDDGWYIYTPDPVQEEPILVKNNRNIFDDRKNNLNLLKPTRNNIPHKRIHNRFGRVCVT